MGGYCCRLNFFKSFFSQIVVFFPDLTWIWGVKDDDCHMRIMVFGTMLMILHILFAILSCDSTTVR